MSERVLWLAGVCFIRTIIPLIKSSSSWPNHHPSPPPNPMFEYHDIWSRVQYMYLEEHKHTVPCILCLCTIFLFVLLFKCFIYLFLSVPGLHCCAWAFSTVASKGYSLLLCMAFTLPWFLLLRSPGSWPISFSSCGFGTLELRLSSCGHWLNYFKACGIFLDQGSNPCPLHWQVDSYPLDWRGSTLCIFLFTMVHPSLVQFIQWDWFNGFK